MLDTLFVDNRTSAVLQLFSIRTGFLSWIDALYLDSTDYFTKFLCFQIIHQTASKISIAVWFSRRIIYLFSGSNARAS